MSEGKRRFRIVMQWQEGNELRYYHPQVRRMGFWFDVYDRVLYSEDAAMDAISRWLQVRKPWQKRIVKEFSK